MIRVLVILVSVNMKTFLQFIEGKWDAALADFKKKGGKIKRIPAKPKPKLRHRMSTSKAKGVGQHQSSLPKLGPGTPGYAAANPDKDKYGDPKKK